MSRLLLAATLAAESHDLRLRLSAGKIDAQTGVIYGVTVGKANVQAEGKFIYLDAVGNIVRDPKLGKKKLPVFTDERFLETLMAAAQDAGGKLKARSDHSDLLQDRAGYAQLFRRTDGAVICDLMLNDSYRDRAIVLETAAKTPDQIGLSIDFVPDFEIAGDKALMRVIELVAVDIVDAGAITPGGLFLSRSVDNSSRVTAEKSQPTTQLTMLPEEIMAEMKKMSESYAAGIAECKAAIAKLSAPVTAPAENAVLSAVNELKTQLSGVTSELTKMKREKALLGFRGTQADLVKLATGSPEDIESFSIAKKTYLQLVAERATTEKCSKPDAHVWVQKNHRDEYALHLSSKGVVKAAPVAA